MTTLKKLEERINELEKQVRDIQTRPVYIQPIYVPDPLPALNPTPYNPSPYTWPVITTNPNWTISGTNSQSNQNIMKDVQIFN